MSAPEERAPRVDLGTALALLSALAAGADELSWSRLLGRVVGHGTVAIALALSVFMLGQGAGALLVRRFGARIRPRTGFVTAELVTGLGALLVVGFTLASPLPSAVLGTPSLALDLAVAGLVTLVPSLAMGAALPLLSDATADEGGPPLARLYAAGLAGAMVGTLLGALVVVPALGADGLGIGAALLHLAVAGLARRLHRGETPATTTPTARTEAMTTAALRFSVAGAIGLGLQPIWSRTIVPYLGVSSSTFAAIVAVYVGAQALGFALHRRVGSVRRGTLGAGDLALAAAAPVALATLGLLGPLSTVMPDRSSGALAFALGAPLAAALVVGPTALLLGLAQADALVRVEGLDRGRGARLSWVSGIGTMASAGAALLSGLVLLPLLGPRLAVAVLGGLGAAVGLSESGAGLVVVLAAIGALVLGRPGPDHFLGAAFDAEELIDLDVRAEGTTAIVRHTSPIEGPLLRLVSGGVSYSGDSRFAQRYMRLLAHLPSLAARGRERALVLCVGTGTTLDALRLHGFAHVDAVDLSPSIGRMLEHFAAVHHDVTADRRVSIVLEDGARFLRLPGPAYDVITLEPPPPRAPGASSLYARELYEAARDRLADGGAVAQWLPLHGLGDGDARAIVRTMAEVFPVLSLHLAERNEAVLVGRREPGPIAEAEGDVRDDLVGIGLGGVEPFADTELLSGDALRDLVSAAPIVRDAWPYPELVPLAPAGAGLDVFLDALRRDGPTSAALLSQVAPAFVRLTEGRGSPEDAERLSVGMDRVFNARPDDPYWSALRPR